jgi:hypothetical protein
MKKTYNVRQVVILLAFTFIIYTLTACISSWGRDNNDAIRETISVQSTWVAHLSTQLAKQEQTNINQWESIGHLYTQMPYALGIITPIPPGVTITPTPTPHSLSDRPTISIDIEYPPDMRTGIDEIDTVIDAIMSGDINARIDLVLLTTTACAMEMGLGGPPKCKGEEEDGTSIDVFPISYGEGIFIRPGSLKEVFSFSVRGLFVVYKVPEDVFKAQYWPAGDYGIVFTSEDDESSHIITVFVEDGRIVKLGFDYDWPPFESVKEMSDEFILPPTR